MHAFNSLSWILSLLVIGVTNVHADDVLVSVTDGDSVTLHTAVKNQQPEDIKWYFNATRIAQLSGDFSDMCTDVQCNEGTERFRDRLTLDRKTGALTILNINTADSGEYQLVVNGNGGKKFIVTVHDDPVSNHNHIKENQGESVTLNPDVKRDPIDVLKCFFNGILIAEITLNQSQICTDVQCKERFTDRLKLDNESASITITNINITDSGNYTFKIFISSDRRFSITREKRFSLTVISPPPSHLSGGAIAGIVILLVVVAAAAIAGVIYYLRHRSDGATAQDDEHVADDPTSVPLRAMGDP